jgi:hypothetical protein
MLPYSPNHENKFRLLPSAFKPLGGLGGMPPASCLLPSGTSKLLSHSPTQHFVILLGDRIGGKFGLQVMPSRLSHLLSGLAIGFE